MRKKIIAGNWKMNKLRGEAVELVKELVPLVEGIDAVDIVVCPVYVSLPAVYEIIKDTNIELGAQDCFWEDSGAYTGEISAPMLKDVGVKYVVIGHSERRQYFCETDEWVNKKTKAALKAGLTPIVCVGERLEEREAGKTIDVISGQLEGGFSGFEKAEIEKCVIAYEPVWAIGTGKTATPEQAQEVHSFIRGWLAEKFGKDVSEKIRIQYGGSVKPANAKSLLSQPDIDGALVGGASLKAQDFAEIVKAGL